MTTMYQLVDDHDENEHDAASDRARARKHLWIWILLAALLLALIATFSGLRDASAPETANATQAERASYHTAISEQDVDLRRARLRDFETTYPNSEHLPAVRAQLAVLDSHETIAWAALTDIMFDPTADRISKLGAISLYEQQWGASYLGGRDDDIRALREELEIDPMPTPDRELAGLESAIPNNVPDNFMVGGPMAVTTPVPSRPYVPPAKPQIIGKTIEPEVTKNVTPRYPRRAQKRGISAVVEMTLSIDDEGKVQMTEVRSVRAEKYENDFVKAAERAARRTRYSPKMVDGKAVPSSGIAKRYVFKMD